MENERLSNNLSSGVSPPNECVLGREHSNRRIINDFWWLRRPGGCIEKGGMVRSVLLILILLPAVATASAEPKPPLEGPLVTVDQVIAMTKAGVPDAVILALIERDRPVFVLASTQIVVLRKEGVSEQIILTMLMTPYSWFGQVPTCSSGPVLTPPPPAPGSSSRGIFFTRPTRGIFFAPPPRPGCR